MTASTVHVSNIAHTTSEKEVSNFFSFCGKITSISLTPSSDKPDAPLSATITFERDAAAKTAVLLDGTPLNNTPLQVSPAQSIEEIAGSHLAPSGDLGPDGEIPQENKPAPAVMAEYLAAGYVLGDSVLQKGIELDKKHQLTTKFASYLTNTLQSIDSKVHATDRAKAADSQYHVTEKARSATSSLTRYFEKALGTGTGQRVRKFYETSEKQVLDIHAEAKRLAELKTQKKRQSQELGSTADGKPFVAPDQTTCACGGEAGSCSCEPGKCACAGCSKAGAKAEAEAKAGPTGQLEHAYQDVKGTAQDAATEKI
jgi:RNA recognition motif-containing protein